MINDLVQTQKEASRGLGGRLGLSQNFISKLDENTENIIVLGGVIYAHMLKNQQNQSQID